MRSSSGTTSPQETRRDNAGLRWFQKTALFAVFCVLSDSGVAETLRDQPAQPELIETDDVSVAYDWIRRNIVDETDLNLADMNLNLAVWVKPADVTRTGTLARAWEHYEFFSRTSVAGTGVRSMYLLHEYRCVEKQRRQLAGSSFSGSNLTGEGTRFDESRPSQWIYVRPNQTDAGVMAAVCDGRYFIDRARETD